MADQFENSFIFISQRPIIRLRSNLLRWCDFPFRGWTFDRKSKFCKFKMAVGRNIEIFSSTFRLSIFWLIDLGITDVESHANTGHEVASVDGGTASLRLGAPFTTHQSHTTARWCELSTLLVWLMCRGQASDDLQHCIHMRICLSLYTIWAYRLSAKRSTTTNRSRISIRPGPDNIQRDHKNNKTFSSPNALPSVARWPSA